MASKHGGQAFPRSGLAEGMTLRDFFAGQALKGLLSAKEQVFAAGVIKGPRTTYDAIARLAYEYADAMLAAREGSDGPA